MYGQDEGLFQEFSRELLAPLLRLVPSGLSSPKAVRLAAAALLSLGEHSVESLLQKVGWGVGCVLKSVFSFCFYVWWIRCLSLCVFSPVALCNHVL